MQLLDDELVRLFALPDGAWVSPDGKRRALILELRREADWPAVAALLGGVQQDFEFPLPALATCADGAFRLFFPLAEPVSGELAEDFLSGLQARYLGEVPQRFLSRPAPDGCLPMPAHDVALDRWTGFIDPSLGSLFAEGGGLDFEPDLQRQAELLRGVSVISARLFEQAWREMARAESPDIDLPQALAIPSTNMTLRDEARAFLRSVMQDGAQTMSIRLQAAALLLQHPE